MDRFEPNCRTAHRLRQPTPGDTPSHSWDCHTDTHTPTTDTYGHPITYGYSGTDEAKPSDGHTRANENSPKRRV